MARRLGVALGGQNVSTAMVQSCSGTHVQWGLRHRRQAVRSALSLRAFARLDQGQESGRIGGDAHCRI